MIGIRLKYVHQWVDKRNGGAKARYYFRGPGFKRILLPGLPGSPEFMDAYQTALGGQPLPRPMIGASQTKIDSIAALVVSYFSSPQFLALAPADATDLLPDPGKIPCGAWRQASGIAHTSAHQRDARPTCSNSCGGQSLAAPSQGADGVCSRGGWRKDDPTRGIKRVKNRSDGFHTWTESKIAMFEARHPIGSKARLALALLLYTAQRRSDVGCQHIRDGVVHVRQQKTGATLAIPLHPGPRRHHRGQSERTPHLPYDELWEKFHSRRLWELVPRAV
jgi:hypothetical protein